MLLSSMCNSTRLGFFIEPVLIWFDSVTVCLRSPLSKSSTWYNPFNALWACAVTRTPPCCLVMSAFNDMRDCKIKSDRKDEKMSPHYWITIFKALLLQLAFADTPCISLNQRFCAEGNMFTKNQNIKYILSLVPGKRRFGIYRFLPIFFCIGGVMEWVMINVRIGRETFCK